MIDFKYKQDSYEYHNQLLIFFQAKEYLLYGTPLLTPEFNSPASCELFMMGFGQSWSLMVLRDPADGSQIDFYFCRLLPGGLYRTGMDRTKLNNMRFG